LTTFSAADRLPAIDPRTGATVAAIPKDLRYTEDHEYLKSGGGDDVFTVGITDYAQGELGDVVYVELPQVGSSYSKQDVFGTIEAVKAVSELFSPVSGEIVEVNERLDKEPQLVNSDPYGEGWMIRIRVSEPSELEGLLDHEGYASHIGQ
jgi:glycine cleavage system H protein